MSFEAIYRRYHQSLYRYCLTIVGNREDAQDALQNTMVKAMRALREEKRQIKLKPWLYRIAHNESIDLLRRRRPTEELDVELAAAGKSAADTAETRERLRQLIADLAELPDRQRGALGMRELAGLSFEQIGDAFDTSPAVARQTVYEARVSLRQMSEGRDMPCDEVCRLLSDADERVLRRRDVRAHLKSCASCREFRDGITARRRDFAALSPLPAIASAALLRSLLGGGGAGASAGAGLGGSIGAGAGKVVATSAIAKSAATVAVVAAVGVGAADRGGLIHVAPTGGESPVTRDATTGSGDPASSSREPGLSTSPAAAVLGRDAAGKRQVVAPGAPSEHASDTATGTDTAGDVTDIPADSPAVIPDKKASPPLHGQKTSNGRNDEVAHQNRGSHGSAGTERGPGGGNSGSAQHSSPRQPGNSAQPGPPPGTDVHAGQSGQTDPGSESGAAGKGKGLRPLLPG
jgi:RNA polymerase sigma factor (sigma-70 family)